MSPITRNDQTRFFTIFFSSEQIRASAKFEYRFVGGISREPKTCHTELINTPTRNNSMGIDDIAKVKTLLEVQEPV